MVPMLRRTRALVSGWGNRLLTFAVSTLAGQSYRDVLSGLRVMSRPVTALDVRSGGFQLESEMNVIAAYLRAHVIEVPIDYRERPENSRSKLNTVRDGLRIASFAVTNWIAFAPMQALFGVATLAALVAGLLGYRVVAGFLETGWPYTTTCDGLPLRAGSLLSYRSFSVLRCASWGATTEGEK